MSALLQVEDLDLYYGDAQALAKVSLEVGADEIVAIVGANGAGKTSLIRAIAGIERARSGSIRFNGTDISRLESHQICALGIGQVAEGRQLFPSLTVIENLLVSAMTRRARAAEANLLDQVFTTFPRLAERRKQLAGTLSGGEQQMLAIGRCLMSQPSLILFDEPSLGLAPNIVQEMLGTIRDLNHHGLTILLVEQNVAASLKICHRGYVLENGSILLSGSGSELLQDVRVKKAYLGL
jgi:branched-chain amino acid transport system ATP-binding protein